MTDVPLDPVIQQITHRFTLTNGAISLPPADFARSASELRQAPIGQRQELAAQLVAVALVLRRKHAAPVSLPVRLQIIDLVMQLLGNAAAASDLFHAAGMEKEAAEVLGTKTELRAPAETTKPETKTVKAARGLRKG